ncbi:MAG: hypothetical protein M4579_006430 [Chaenotheca gracillima]|nr:MAG: hypothetical protein M4579_006430 [Chaenotheca gracillima]
MSRPSTQRTASTNLSGGAGRRSLEGKLAIITGASRGIGAGIADNLASKGCSVVLNYTSESSTQRANDLAAHLESKYSIRALVVQADIGSATGPAHIVATAKNNFSHPKTGAFRVDIVINNAGVAGNQPIEEVTSEEFHRQYSVNVLGPLLLIQAVLPYLPTDRSGRIVNVTSVSSSLGFKLQSVYGGTKAALEAMTRTWSRELAERATVNSVNPGPVKTDMYGSTDDAFRSNMTPFLLHTPLAGARTDLGDTTEQAETVKEWGGREARDDEIAGVVGMLCSPEAGWTTGGVVCANGGMIMHT